MQNMMKGVSVQLRWALALSSLWLSACGGTPNEEIGDDAQEAGIGGDEAPSDDSDGTSNAGSGGAGSSVTAMSLQGQRLSYAAEETDFDSSSNGSVATSYNYELAIDLCGDRFVWQDYEQSCVSVSGSFGGSGMDCTPSSDNVDTRFCQLAPDHVACRYEGTWQIGAVNGATTLDLTVPGVGTVQFPIVVSGSTVQLNGQSGTLAPSPTCR
jgi:hypothetical protein